jgi:hypothetical protein
MLVVGSTAVSFIPGNPQTDLARCQRYYQQIGGVNAGQAYDFAVGMAESTTRSNFIWRFQGPMRITPTCTVTGATSFQIQSGGTVLNCTSVSAAAATNYSAYVTLNTASGQTAGFGTIALTNGITAILAASADL